MGQTLEQKINAGIARHQFSLDDYREHPTDVHLRCWCGDSLLIDYLHFGMSEMSRRLTAFLAKHKACIPQEDLP